jgi:N-acetylglucosamine-6-phosphate deacetylase
MHCIRSVQLVLLDRILESAWVTFDSGKVVAFGQGEPPQSVGSTDGGNLYLAPGFIDTHVHGGNGADFLDGTPEAFLTVADYHLSQGTTSICPTLATATYEHIKSVVESWDKVKDRSAARLLSVHLEGPHLAASKAGAQDPKLLRPATDNDIGWLVENASRIAQMTVAPELPNALKLIESATKAGIVISAGHTESREQEIRAGLDHGVTKVTHLFNAMTYAAKSGLFRQAGLAEYALVEDRLSCELIADGFHAEPVLMKLAYQSKGPNRLALVSDALAGTGLPVGSKFMLGKLHCKVAEGYCALADGSALAGSATRLVDQVRIMATSVGVPLVDAFRMASHTPAKLLGVADRYGVIAPGHAADFVRLDSKFQVHDVWVSGKIVHSATNRATHGNP